MSSIKKFSCPSFIRFALFGLVMVIVVVIYQWPSSARATFVSSSNAKFKPAIYKLLDTTVNTRWLEAVPSEPLATITVNSLEDTATASDGKCTLREAITNANADGQTTGGDCTAGAGADMITFSVTGTINLTSALPIIASDMTISGPGTSLLDVHRSTAAAYRIFRINSPSTVSITGLKITNGNSPVGENGGGILNLGTLSLSNCVISGNTSDSFGGGVTSNFGPLTITNSTISSNNAADGGGVAALLGASLVMTNSTVSGNTCANAGGGLDLLNNTFSLTNCTISGNTSSNTGGGIYHAGNGAASSLTLINCTVTGNSMRGIKTQTFNMGSAVTTLKNTLVADNSPTNFLSDFGGVATTMGNNLDNDGSSGFANGVNGDIVATGGSLIDAKLGPLADYGGPAPTRALLFNSPAINTGSNTGAPATDARGLARPVGATVDIGAFEFNVSLSPTTLPAGTVGVAYSQTITASGGTAPYTFSVIAGALPAGLTLAPTTGVLSGTPVAAGTFNITIRATGANGFAGAGAYVLTINPGSCPVTITLSPTSLPAGTVGTAYSQTITASGGTAPYTFSVISGTLPSGLSLSAGGALTGTPTLPATFSFTVRATDFGGCVGDQAYMLTIGCPTITVNPATLPAGTIGAVYNQTFTATGGTAPYTFALTGTLPTGLSFSAATATLSGTPTQTGSFPITVTATDSKGCTGSRSYTLAINCPTITINPAVSTLPAGTAGLPYTQTFTASGGAGPYTFSQSAGTLPPGLTLASSGILSGAPTGFGTFNFTVRATDANTCMGERAYTLLINPPCGTITINPATLPNGFLGTPYNQALTSVGGAAPYTFMVSAGSLPNGLSLSSAGVLSGTPTALGTFSFTIKATDNNGCMGTRAYSVIVSGDGLVYFPLPTPVRLLDTRPGLSGCFTPGMPLGNDAVRTQVATGACSGVPATAKAIVGNATVVNFISSGSHVITLYPSDAARPVASNLNFSGNQIVPNNFTVGLGTDGAFKIYSSASTHFIVDITGYYAPPGTGGLYYHPLPRPVRLLETRPDFPGFPLTGCFRPNAPLTGNASRTQQARGTCDGLTIPTNAVSIVGNATVVNTGASSQAGFVTLYPSNAALPTASNLNFVSGQIVPNAFTVGLGSDGAFKIFTSATTDFIVDIAGYYSPDATDINGAGLLFSPLPRPLRLLETRPDFPGFPLTGCFRTNAPLAGNTSRTQPARITCDGITIPANALSIVGNATVVNNGGSQSGFVTLYPSDATLPTVSNLNFIGGQIVPNAFTVGLGTVDGAFKIFPSATTHFIVDVSGYFAP